MEYVDPYWHSKLDRNLRKEETIPTMHGLRKLGFLETLDIMLIPL